MGAYFSQLSWANESYLERTKGNEQVLERIVERLHAWCKQYPEQAAIPFKEAIEFETPSVRPASFRTKAFEVEFKVDDSADSVESVSNEDGEPHYILHSLEDEGERMTLCKFVTMRMASYHLEAAAANATRELRAILEATPDLLVRILGTSYVDDLDRLQAEHDDKRSELAIALKRLNLRSIRPQRDGRSVNAVEAELKQLQNQYVCGQNAEQNALKYISFESDFVYANGARAPPWRESVGELAYIMAGTFDVGNVCITASQNGYFQNQGYYIDEKDGVQKLNYEAVEGQSGRTHNDLVSVLRLVSPHFEVKIDGSLGLFLSGSTRRPATDRPMNAHELDGEDAMDDSEEDVPPRESEQSKSFFLTDLDQDMSRPRKPDTSGGAPRSRSKVLDQSHGSPLKSASRRLSSSGQSPVPISNKSSKSKIPPLAGKGPISDRYMQLEMSPSPVPLTPQGALDSMGPFPSPRTKRATSASTRAPSSMSGGGSPGGWNTPHGDPYPAPRTPRTRYFMNAPLDLEGALAQTTKRRQRRLKRLSRRGGSKAPAGRKDDGSDSDLDSGEDQEEVYELFRREVAPSADIAQINKLFKFLKGGNNSATVIALSSLRDTDFTVEENQLAVFEVGGIPPLLKLLSSDEGPLRDGAALILRNIALNGQVRFHMMKENAVETLLESFSAATDLILKTSVADTIGNLARAGFARRKIFKRGGLADLLRDLKQLVGIEIRRSLLPDEPLVEGDEAQLTRAITNAVWNLSKSPRNKDAIRVLGGLDPIIGMFQCDNIGDYSDEIEVAAAGCIMQLGHSLENRKIFLQTKVIDRACEMLKRTVAGDAQAPGGASRKVPQQTGNVQLQVVLSGIMFSCGDDPAIRRIIRASGVLNSLVTLTQSRDPDVVYNSTGALWKCCADSRIVDDLVESGAIGKVKSLLSGAKIAAEDVQVNVCAMFANIGRTSDGRLSLLKCGALDALVDRLKSTNHVLVFHACFAIAACGTERACLNHIMKRDGLMLVWSLLQLEDPSIQAAAATAIGSLVSTKEMAADAGRTFVGNLSLLVRLLQSEDEGVQAAVCGAIANLSQHSENAAIITEEGALPALAKLTVTASDKVRAQLARAISTVGAYGDNQRRLGNLQAVVPLVEFLRSGDPLVHRYTAMAINVLSRDPDNSILLRKADAVQYLVELIASTDEELQDNAGEAIQNIRFSHLNATEEGDDYNPLNSSSRVRI